MASSGDELAAFQTTADGAKDLLPAIDRLARKLRERIGESMTLVRADPPLAQVTTGSLEALKKYTAALQYNAQGDYARALALLRDATRIDPTFAMAYRQLLLSTGNTRQAGTGLGGYPDQSEVLVRTYEKLCPLLRDRIPERERLQTVPICQSFYGDRIKALVVSDTLLNEYPNTPGALNAIALSYRMNLREFARAESMFARVIESEPNTPFAYFNIVEAQIAQGKYDAAAVSLDRARRRFPARSASGGISEPLYNLGRRDSAEASARAQASGVSVLDRLNGHNTLSVLAALRGRIAEARTHLAEARALERESGEQSSALGDSLIAARIEIVFFNNPSRAVRTLDRALAETPLESIGWIPSRPYLRIASLYAQAHRVDKAKATLAAYDRAVDDTSQRRRDQPDRDAALGYIALADQRPRDAVAAFRRSDMQSDGPVDMCAVCAEPSVGLAFDRAGMADSAIATLEHYVNAPSVHRRFVDAWNLHWALRRLGELHEARGDSAEAVRYYQRFVELWKNADPELKPTVTRITQHLARLSTRETTH
jgi:tetratricopeptide (TPR) repeat protein